MSLVESMLTQRAKQAALEKLSFIVARPEHTSEQQIPRSYVVLHLESDGALTKALGVEAATIFSAATVLG